MKRPILITALLAVAVAGTAYYTKSKAAQVSWPAPFTPLSVGATQDEVLDKVGKPQSQSVNPLFETKTEAQWSYIESQVDDMEARVGDPNAAVSAAERAKYVSLSRSLQHRTKVVWMYPPISAATGPVALSFDGEGKLLRLDVQNLQHAGGPQAPASAKAGSKGK